MRYLYQVKDLAQERQKFKRLLAKVIFHFFLFSAGMVSAVYGKNPGLKQVIKHIKIYGNHHFSQETILKIMGIRQGKNLPGNWPDKSVTNLLSQYHKDGYLLARVDSVWTKFSHDTNFVDINVSLFEGELVRVGRVKILGVEKNILQDIFGLLETRPGKIFNEEIFQQDIKQILLFFENMGYPLSQIKIRSLLLYRDRKHTKIDIVLEIKKGSLVTIGSIVIKGNTLTKDKVILRETRLKIGNIYRQQEVMSARENLQKLGYFKSVAQPEITFVKDKAILVFNVKEGNSSTIDGVIGYSPPVRAEEKGYFTGRLLFTFPNLFGTGRFLEAYWEKKDQYSQSMRFGYQEPWLFNLPLNVGAWFGQDIRDTTYIEREWRFSVQYLPWSSLSISLEGGEKDILPDSLGSILYNLAQTKSLLLTFGIDYNTLNNFLNPMRGVRYHTTFTTGKKRNLGPDFLRKQKEWRTNVNTKRIRVDAEAAVSIFRNQVLYLGFHGIEVKTSEPFVPLSDQVRFGGARTLRGYREDAFRGSLVVWSNLEYRYLLGKYSRVFLFLDTGMYQRREKELGLVKGTKVGYGFGVRLETRVGLFGIDFGLGKGDSLMRAKVHVGLVNKF